MAHRRALPDGARDLILTPNWAWHEHGNTTGRRSVWLDALDIPLAQNLGPMFMEHGGANARENDLSAIPDRAFAVAGYLPDTDAPPPQYSPMFRYPRSRTRAALEAAPVASDGARRVRYTNPRMTLRYAHLGDQEVEAAAGRVGQSIAHIMGV